MRLSLDGTFLKIDTSDQVAMSKRIALLKMERNLTKEDTYTLDAETTVDFDEKVRITAVKSLKLNSKQISGNGISGSHKLYLQSF